MILGILFDWLGFWCLRGILDCCLLLGVRVKPDSLGGGLRECSFGFLCDFVVAGLRGGLTGLLSGCLLVWRWYFDLGGC